MAMGPCHIYLHIPIYHHLEELEMLLEVGFGGEQHLSIYVLILKKRKEPFVENLAMYRYPK